jgi:hypothetical protein
MSASVVNSTCTLSYPFGTGAHGDGVWGSFAP